MATKQGQGESQTGTLPDTLTHLLNEYQVAETLGVSVSSLRRWRLLRQGPRFLKVGALCKYRPQDIVNWLESRPSGGQGNTVTPGTVPAKK